MTLNLYENQVVRDATGRNLRLLWLPPCQPSLATIDISPGGGMPFWTLRRDIEEQFEAGLLTVLTDDPAAATIRTDSDLTDTEKRIRDKRLDYIVPLVEDPERRVLFDEARPDAIRDHIRAAGGTKKFVYKLTSLWWRSGQLPNALIPAFSASAASRKAPVPGTAKLGRPRYAAGGHGLTGINATAEIVDLMKVGERFLKEGQSVSKAYTNMLLLNFSEQVIIDGQRRNAVKPDHAIPSQDQFLYHIVRKLGRGEILRAVKGDTRFERRNRPRLGTTKDAAFGPGSNYQMDATIADIYLRSHARPDRLIGRPVLYIVIDVYSRMIVGFCVALSGPSWETAKLALENAMTDKVAFCARLGIDIDESEWPARHLCRNLTMDRGSEVTSENSRAAAKGLKYKRVHLPPYRPDWKGLVESRFDLIHEEDIKWAPGASHGRERGEPKHQLDATYTLATFTELIALCVLKYNRSFQINNPPSDYVSPDGRPPVPNLLWQHGCANSAPQLAEADRVRANLLHVGKARESEGGLFCNGLHYCRTNTDGSGMFRRVPGRGWSVHDIRFDPRDISSILLPVDKGARFEAFHLTPADREHAGLTLDEFRDNRAIKRVGTRLGADDRHQSEARHQADMADLNRRVAQDAKGVRLTPASAKGIRAERAQENREARREGAWTPMPAPSPRNTPDADKMPVTVAEPAQPAVLEPVPVPDSGTPEPHIIQPEPVALPRLTRLQMLAAAAQAARDNKKED